MLEIKMRTDDDAMIDNPEEVARMLEEIATKIRNGEPEYPVYQTIFDANGNDVGRWKYVNKKNHTEYERRK